MREFEVKLGVYCLHIILFSYTVDELIVTFADIYQHSTHQELFKNPLILMELLEITVIMIYCIVIKQSFHRIHINEIQSKCCIEISFKNIHIRWH